MESSQTSPQYKSQHVCQGTEGLGRGARWFARKRILTTRLRRIGCTPAIPYAWHSLMELNTYFAEPEKISNLFMLHLCLWSQHRLHSACGMTCDLHCLGHIKPHCVQMLLCENVVVMLLVFMRTTGQGQWSFTTMMC